MRAYVGTVEGIKDTFFIDFMTGQEVKDEVSIFHYSSGSVSIQMPLETAKKLFEQMSVELANLIKRR